MQPQRTADQAAFRNVVPLAIGTVAWVATVALATFGPVALWDQPILSWTALVVNVAVGVGWIIIHARYLRGVDELQRKIMLDAIAVALGVGLVGGCALVIAHTSKLIAFEPNIGFLVVVMAVVYILGVAVGQVRYR